MRIGGNQLSALVGSTDPMHWALGHILLLLIGTLFALPSQATDAELEGTLERLSERMEVQLRERFELAGVDYPPQRIQLIALKQTRRLELWAFQQGSWRYVHDYPVFAASGQAGPKLREGDKQVPEGFYQIVELNPNSHFHLSLKLNYPNTFDWLQALREDRKKPGSNIFIHGSAWSAGCLAIGNRYVEELFYLVGTVGLEESGVMILPYDFRVREVSLSGEEPDWLAGLYARLKLRMEDFPLAAKARACGYRCREARAVRQPAVLPGEGL